MQPVSVNRKSPRWRELRGSREQEALDGFCQRECFDRSDTLRHSVNIANISPLPDFSVPFRKSFADVCDERAEELVKIGKELHVFWSGGIDSTAALVTLLKAAPHDQVVVLMTENSIGEFPSFYRSIVSKARHETVHCLTQVSLSDNHQYVSGELGDQVHGGRNGFRAGSARKITMPPALREFIEPVIQKIPREFKTDMDVMWLLNFVFKWQSTKARMMYMIRNPGFARLAPFYDSPEFQRWSVLSDERLQTPDPIQFKSNMTYKGCAKRYIDDFFHDENYLTFKCKHPSLGPLGMKFPHSEWSHILEDGSVVR